MARALSLGTSTVYVCGYINGCDVRSVPVCTGRVFRRSYNIYVEENEGKIEQKVAVERRNVNREMYGGRQKRFAYRL